MLVTSLVIAAVVVLPLPALFLGARGLLSRRGYRPDRFIPMLNAARSPTFYEFDSGDLLRLYREMDDRDEEPVVIYHSHTATEAYPSRTDISYASEPNAHYVLVSTREHGPQTGLAGDEVEFRSFRIVDGEVSEEEVEVVESYLFGHTPTTVVYD